MPKNTVSIGTQTELIVDNIRTLKTELQSRIDEMASLKKAEPKDIQQWKILEIVKKLCLYTGLSSFIVLMAVFIQSLVPSPVTLCLS